MSTSRMRAAEWIGYYLATHPRLRRVIILFASSYTLALWSIVAAPPALASTMAGAFNWTGLADTHGVPAGAYYLSVVNTTEAIAKAGPAVKAPDIADPSSWARFAGDVVSWTSNAVTTGVSHGTMASWLQVEISIYVGMLTTAVWLLRFAMSSTWLYWLATWFRPLLEVLRQLLIELLVFPICMTIGLAVGGWHILIHGRHGKGTGTMLSAMAIGAFGLVVTREPLNELYSDNGLLTRARNLGFGVAQAAMYNHSIASGAAGQMKHLTGALLDAMLRAPLQIHNFGMVIDGIGVPVPGTTFRTCGAAWDNAILAGQPDGPAHAMGPIAQGGCGATLALSFAQHLDGSNFGVGLLLGVLGLAFSFFIVYLAYSYVMVACAAFLTGVMALFAVGPAMIAGHSRRRATHRVKEFFKHLFRVFAYVTYASLAAVIILRMAAPGGYAAQVNMTHPVALLVLIALTSMVATAVFWWFKHELGDHTRSDLIRSARATSDAVRSGYNRGQQVYGRGRQLYHQGRERIIRRGDHDTTDSASNRDEPLTGRPAAGRPPGGRPPTTSRGGRPPSRPSPTPVTSRTTTDATVNAGVTTGGTPSADGSADRTGRPTQQPQRQPAQRTTPPAETVTREEQQRQRRSASDSTPDQPVAGRDGQRKARDRSESPSRRTDPNTPDTPPPTRDQDPDGPAPGRGRK